MALNEPLTEQQRLVIQQKHSVASQALDAAQEALNHMFDAWRFSNARNVDNPPDPGGDPLITLPAFDAGATMHDPKAMINHAKAVAIARATQFVNYLQNLPDL
jgi:hypothetical protein